MQFLKALRLPLLQPGEMAIERRECPGEGLHGLRELLLFANKGTLRKKQEELRNQAGCLPPERWSGRRG